MAWLASKSIKLSKYTKVGIKFETVFLASFFSWTDGKAPNRVLPTGSS